MSQSQNDNSQMTLDDALKKFSTGVSIGYNEIIDCSYKTNDDTGSNNGTSVNVSEEVNILMDYPWTIDKFAMKTIDDPITKQKQRVNFDIPHCYAIEYKQIHNSSITNFINSLVAGVNSVSSLFGKDGNLREEIQTRSTAITDLYSSLQKSTNETANSDNGFLPTIKEKMESFLTGTVSNLTPKNGITSSKYLKPYSLLYWLNPTNKRYVFPMISNPPSQHVGNSYGEGNQQSNFLTNNAHLNLISGILHTTTNVAQDLRDLGSLFGGSGEGFIMSGVEKAKYFQYPTETEEYTIQFPLINTVSHNQTSNSNNAPWITNYTFIVLFCLRNMVFRKDNASFYPPLFYDLVIPGVVRQPFCYVSSIQVSPRGQIKQKKLPKFLGRDVKNSISVPEQWHVIIKFKSLLATSANMVLSSMFELAVQSRTT